MRKVKMFFENFKENVKFNFNLKQRYPKAVKRSYVYLTWLSFINAFDDWGI